MLLHVSIPQRIHVYILLLLSLSLFYIVFLRCALADLIPRHCRFSALHSVFSCIPSALHSWDVFMCDTSHRPLFYSRYISATPTVQWHHIVSAYAAHVVCRALHYSTFPLSVYTISNSQTAVPYRVYMMLRRYSLSCALSVSSICQDCIQSKFFNMMCRMIVGDETTEPRRAQRTETKAA